MYETLLNKLKSIRTIARVSKDSSRWRWSFFDRAFSFLSINANTRLNNLVSSLAIACWTISLSLSFSNLKEVIMMNKVRIHRARDIISQIFERTKKKERIKSNDWKKYFESVFQIEIVRSRKVPFLFCFVLFSFFFFCKLYDRSIFRSNYQRFVKIVSIVFRIFSKHWYSRKRTNELWKLTSLYYSRVFFLFFFSLFYIIKISEWTFGLFCRFKSLASIQYIQFIVNIYLIVKNFRI